MKASLDRVAELLAAEPPAALDALVLERALATFQRCAGSSRHVPSDDVKGPARDRALDQTQACPGVLSPVRS
jgi:hypothetical protein